MEKSEFIVEDSASYSSGGDKLGFRVICLEQYRRCIIEGSKTATINQYFISAVKMLGIMLLPKFKHNKEFKEKFYANEELMEKEKKEHMEKINDLNKRKKPTNNLTFGYQEGLMVLNREKLSILTHLLEQLNFFEEETVDSFDFEV